MTGETFDGKRAKEMGLVNDAVPKDQLRERTRKLAQTLLEKNPVVLRARKQAYKHVRDMTWEQSADYLASKMDQISHARPRRRALAGHEAIPRRQDLQARPRGVQEKLAENE